MELTIGMTIIAVALVGVAVVTRIAMRGMTGPAAEVDPALEPSLTPRTSQGLDPLEHGLTDRAEFDSWVNRFLNPTYLDGQLVKTGEGVEVRFKTLEDGRIVLHSIVI